MQKFEFDKHGSENYKNWTLNHGHNLAVSHRGPSAHTNLVPTSCPPMKMIAVVVNGEAVLLSLHLQLTLPNAVGTSTNSASLVTILQISYNTSDNS